MGKTGIVIWFVVVFAAGAFPAGSEESGVDFSATGYLVKTPDAVLFVREPAAVTGMFWFSGTAYRLNPDVAECLDPFVITDSTGSTFTHIPNGMPREPRDGAPIPILTVRARLSLVVPDAGNDSRRYERPDISSIYRVFSIEIVDAEFVGHEWYSELKHLNVLLEEVSTTTLEAPSENKRKRLLDLIEQGSRFLHELVKPPIREEWKELVHGFSPDASMETRWQRKEALERGRILGVCAKRLGIEPETPFPPDLQTEVRETSIAAVSSGTHEIEKTGLRVHLFRPDELAKYLALEGFVIEDTAENRSGFAVRPGDIVIVRPYSREFIREMADEDAESAERYLRQKAASQIRGSARQDRVLRVIRDGEATDLPFTEGGK